MFGFVLTQTTVSEGQRARACASVVNCPAPVAPTCGEGATGAGAAGADAGAVTGAGAGAPGAALVGIVSVPARQAATKSFLVCFDALMAALFAAYSVLHSATVFANAGAVGNASNALIAAAASE